MDLLLDRLPTPIGTILLVCRGDALRAQDFGKGESRLHRWLSGCYGACGLAPEKAPAAIRHRLRSISKAASSRWTTFPSRPPGQRFNSSSGRRCERSRQARP